MVGVANWEREWGEVKPRGGEAWVVGVACG